jgi:thiaminase/transcriptional activator TenA
MASLLPCQWGYWEIGQALAAQGLPTNEPFYAEWIEMYSGSEYRELAERLRATFDRAAARASADELARVHDIFTTSSRYEYAFWDAAFRLESWPV